MGVHKNEINYEKTDSLHPMGEDNDGCDLMAEDIPMCTNQQAPTDKRFADSLGKESCVVMGFREISTPGRRIWQGHLFGCGQRMTVIRLGFRRHESYYYYGTRHIACQPHFSASFGAPHQNARLIRNVTCRGTGGRRERVYSHCLVLIIASIF